MKGKGIPLNFCNCNYRCYSAMQSKNFYSIAGDKLFGNIILQCYCKIILPCRFNCCEYFLYLVFFSFVPSSATQNRRFSGGMKYLSVMFQI